jgi:hypothetical protein
MSSKKVFTVFKKGVIFVLAFKPSFALAKLRVAGEDRRSSVHILVSCSTIGRRFGVGPSAPRLAMALRAYLLFRHHPSSSASC